MKRFFLLILFLLFASVCFAETSGQVVNYEVIGDTLYLKCHFYHNGNLIRTGKPGNFDYIDIHKSQIDGLNDAQLEAFLTGLVHTRCEQIILAHHKFLGNMLPQENANKNIADTLEDRIHDIHNAVLAIDESVTTVSVPVDTDQDGEIEENQTVTDSLIAQNEKIK